MPGTAIITVDSTAKIEKMPDLKLILEGDHLQGWDREGGREPQEGGDMGIYVYV